jgi:hypothetical protein
MYVVAILADLHSVGVVLDLLNQSADGALAASSAMHGWTKQAGNTPPAWTSHATT